MERKEAIEQIRMKIAQCGPLVVLTGAGVSAESGVPTFRGAGGLWRSHKAVDLATPEAFQKDPELVWEFYNWRREVLATAEPNAAHCALVEMEKRVEDFTLLTQNIDGLHQEAGTRRVLELHGNIWEVRCTGCGFIEDRGKVPLERLPHCSQCGELVRPNVVWFGEALDANVLRAAFEALERCQVRLVIGTSAVVQPAASMGLYAKERGAYVVEINLEPTPLSPSVDVSLKGKAGEIVSELVIGEAE